VPQDLGGIGIVIIGTLLAEPLQLGSSTRR
jgi:hypothetical protein